MVVCLQAEINWWDGVREVGECGRNSLRVDGERGGTSEKYGSILSIGWYLFFRNWRSRLSGNYWHCRSRKQC